MLVVDLNTKTCQTLPFKVDSAMVNPACPDSATAGHLLAFKSMHPQLIAT